MTILKSELNKGYKYSTYDVEIYKENNLYNVRGFSDKNEPKTYFWATYETLKDAKNHFLVASNKDKIYLL